MNVASVAGVRGFRGGSAYSAAKHGVVGLTRSLALEAAQSGVTVNAVCPGYTATDMADRAAANVSRQRNIPIEAAEQVIARTLPLGRLIRPEEVAETVGVALLGRRVCRERASHRDRGRGPMSPSDAITPRHFGWSLDGRVATITLNRPERKNPLTFDSYAELVETFERLRSEDRMRDAVRAVVLTGAGGNFSSGGDVHEIIGPLVRMKEEAGSTICSPSPGSPAPS